MNKTVYEYEEISHDIELHKFISRNEKLKDFFTCSWGVLKAKSHVGIFKYKNTQYEILPKLLNKESIDDNTRNTILKNLLYMLSLTKKLDIKESDIAKISNAKNPFLEILIKIYAESLFDCLKKSVPKNYITEEDNLNFIKGKIIFSKNIIKNSANRAKFYCRYDEFSENNLLNQMFYYISYMLYGISSDNNTKKTLKLITNFFCDITLKKVNVNKIKNLQLTKSQAIFAKPFSLAKMFLENCSVDFTANKIESVALFWNMNKLFEEFIFEFIKKYQSDIDKNIKSIISQKNKKILKNVDSNNKIGNTYVDVFIKLPDKKVIILDTKYKIKTDDKIESGDIFQMLAYEAIHNTDKAILLYPTLDKNYNIIKYEYNIDDNSTLKNKLITATVYLGNDLINDGKEDLISNLSKIIKSAINYEN